MLFRSSIGKKVIMSVTGLIWIGYLLLHMYGNLKAFGGPEVYNHYAESLRLLGEPLLGIGHALFSARVIFVVSIALHIWAAISLKVMAVRARPQNYDTYRIMEANYATVTMRWGGAVIAAFLLYHVAHFTWGARFLQPDFTRGEPYQNLVAGFNNPIHLALYLFALIVVGLHLYHGAFSFFQTMGWRSASYEGGMRALATILALAIPIGFAVLPLSVASGLLR